MDLLISHNFRQEALSWPSSITYTIKYVFSFHVFSPCYNTNSWSCISYWLCSQSQLWLSFQKDSFWNAYLFLRHKLSLRDESWKKSRQIFGSDDGGMCTKDSIFFLSFWDLYYRLHFATIFKRTSEEREDIMEVVPVSCGDCFAFEFPSKNKNSF